MPALDGMRVLDMTQYEAGTSCTQALAWLGADVVKIERPDGGDPGRVVSTGTDHSPYFLTWNSNKRSVTLDLMSAAGRDLFLRLVANFDVFVENYGPGVIEKMDIGYDVVRRVHPSIIYGRVKGFGLSGPYAGYKCYDMITQAMGGGFSVTGDADGPPMRPGPTFGDAGSGVQMALSITAAYVEQLRTGEGQLIELSMQEAYTYYMRTLLANSGDYGRAPAPRLGNAWGAPTDLYPCMPAGADDPSAPPGSNDYVYIMVVTTRMWDTLCVAIERADLLADPRFERGRDRREHRDALHAEISAWTRRYTKHEAMRILGEAGVPCGYVADTTDYWKDPHLRERGMIQTVQHAEVGPLDLLRWPALMRGANVQMSAAPLLGEHTEAVLSQELGLSQSEIAKLTAQGVLGAGEAPEGAELDMPEAAR